MFSLSDIVLPSLFVINNFEVEYNIEIGSYIQTDLNEAAKLLGCKLVNLNGKHCYIVYGWAVVCEVPVGIVGHDNI